MESTNPVTREGISAGLIGATVIALWFALLDAVRGRMLDTPVTLGTALGTLFLNGESPGRAAAILLYTLFHVGAFLLVGIIFAWVVHRAEKVPSAFIGFAGLFVAFEVGWIGFTTVLAEGFGDITWAQVLVANLIAAAAMGFYMWRQHPALPGRVSRVLAGAPE